MGDAAWPRLRLKFKSLLDPSTDQADLVHEEPDDVSVPEARRNLRKKYDEHPEAGHIELTVGGVVVGVTSRARVFEDLGQAGGEPGVGDGDRATQPGESSQYRVLVIACKSCGGTATTMFYDERTTPACCANGRMELRR